MPEFDYTPLPGFQRHRYGHVLNLSSQRFGKLLVLEFAGIHFMGNSRKKGAFWRCLCDCGNEVFRAGQILKKVKSCGCLSHDPHETTHGHKRAGKVTKVYRTWSSMKNRCLNPTGQDFARYGGRGITICARWQNSFENFYADMGDPPSSKYSIDRIDYNGNYEPSNCRWATSLEQQRNRSNNKYITHNNITLTLVEWAESHGVRDNTLGWRLNHGWSMERALIP